MGHPLLWHFPVSHFNEKVRWALDYKRIPHVRRALGPGYLLQAWWATRQGHLPILFLDGGAIADSTHIIGRLEQFQRDPPLYPADPQTRARALALEDFFDEHLGPAIRTVIVGEMFATDPDAALSSLMRGMSHGARRAARAMTPLFRAFYAFRHKITPETIARGRQQVVAAINCIERELQPSGYLAGDRFSVADLTAAALLSPVTLPAEFPYPASDPLPATLAAYRAELADRRAFQWALDIYRRHRGTSAEIAR